MQETAVENPYGLVALIQNGDIIARSILVILLIMSLLTWFIMITKFFDQRRQRLQAIAAEKEFWDAPNLTDAIGRLKGSSNPFRALAETGKQAAEYHEINKGRLSGAIGTSEWITESLQRTADTVISSMQSGLPVLASAGATAPFVGLLGTVIGIYHGWGSTKILPSMDVRSRTSSVVIGSRSSDNKTPCTANVFCRSALRCIARSTCSQSRRTSQLAPPVDSARPIR